MRMNSALTLGIDLGTQGLKAVVYDAGQRRIVASALAPLSVDRDAFGKAEQDAADWLHALRAALAELPASLRAGVGAIAVSGQQHGFVPLADDGRVLAPVKLWCDTATQSEAEALAAALGGASKCIEIAGNPIAVGYTASKILWLRRNRPEAYADMRHILLPHDYLNYVLTGRICMECGDASGTGLLDVRNRRWSDELIRALDPDRDLRECLPPLVEAHRPIGLSAGAFVRECGLPEGVMVMPGGGDNMMAAIGTGNVSAGTVTVSLGTSGTVFACSDAPVVDPDGHVAAFADSTGRWLPLICTMNCTLATEAVRELLDTPLDALDALAASVAVGSDGLLMLPFLQGERTPALPDARGALLGISTSNLTRAHLVRAAMEGAACGLRFGLDALRKRGVVAERVVLTGGGSRSVVWRQMISDLFAMPVSVLQSNEGAALGAALQALWGVALADDPDAGLGSLVALHLPEAPELAAAPDAAAVAAYESVYRRYLRALQSTDLSRKETST